MDDLQYIYIDAVSMITPVGGNALMTTAAVKAGASAYMLSSIIGRKFSPLKIAPVPVSNEDLWAPDLSNEKPLYQQSRSKRMLALAAYALTEILPSCPDAPLPIFLAGPESVPFTAIDGHFLTLLSQAAPDRIDSASSRLIATGRPAGLQTIELAFRYLSQTNATHVLVGGVDSLIDLLTLGTLTNEDRTLSEDAADGFTPAEGAAFLLLSKVKTDRSISTLREPGVSTEPGHRYSQEPYRGEGLSNAVARALQNYSGPLIQTIYSSMNGESFGAKEHGVSVIRNQKHFKPDFNVEHPADCLGDLGAAAAPVLIALAAANCNSKRIPSSAIICCSADQEIRAACIVTNLMV